MSLPLISKATARYTGAGGKEHCSLCRHFSPRRGGRCARVLGDISPMGWCKLFSREIRALIADVPFVAGGGGPVPALALDFMTPGTLSPLITFTRASTGTYFDSAGVMQTAAIDAPRWDYDPATLQLRGLLLEDTRTNNLRNSTMVGAVPGTPGTYPTNWSGWSMGASALSSTIVGTGTEAGMAYIDMRIFGTAGANAGIGLVVEQPLQVVAANGQAWDVSAYWRLVAGTLNGTTTWQVFVRELTSAGAFIKDNVFTVTPPTSAPLLTQRVQGGIALNGGGTVARVQPRYNINVTAGAAVDFTLRLGGIQMELGGFATSYIPTTSAAVTRAIDRAFMTGAGFTSWFTNAAGTFATEAIFVGFSPTVFARLIELSDGTSNNLLAWYPDVQTGGRYIVNSTIATVAGTNVIIAGMPLANVVNKVSVSYGAARSMCLNQGGAGPSTVASAPGVIATVNRLDFGNRGSAPDRPGNMWLRQVRFWSRQFTDAELQSVTT